MQADAVSTALMVWTRRLPPDRKPALAQRMLTGIEILGNQVLLDTLVALEPLEVSLQEPRRVGDWQFQF